MDQHQKTSEEKQTEAKIVSEMLTVKDRHQTDWEIKFVSGILRQLEKPKFVPSDKQLAVLQRILKNDECRGKIKTILKVGSESEKRFAESVSKFTNFSEKQIMYIDRIYDKISVK